MQATLWKESDILMLLTSVQTEVGAVRRSTRHSYNSITQKLMYVRYGGIYPSDGVHSLNFLADINVKISRSLCFQLNCCFSPSFQCLHTASFKHSVQPWEEWSSGTAVCWQQSIHPLYGRSCQEKDSCSALSGIADWGETTMRLILGGYSVCIHRKIIGFSRESLAC